MLWLKQVRGPYLCYTVEREFLTSDVIEQKPQLMDDIKNPEHDVALDIRKLHHVDTLSLRFLANVDEQMDASGRRLVLVGGDAEVLAQFMKLRSFQHYSSMADFELEFHDISPSLLKSILQLAQGGSGFKMLQLECPLCHFHEVTGFVLDESKYRLAWSAREIVPLWVPISPEVEPIDFGAYRVAVCPQCFFASVRPDHFIMHFPEGDIKSILKSEQITNLAIAGNNRKALAHEEQYTTLENFFQPPREPKASYLSWKLHEHCQKQLFSDRHNIDAFEIVLSNFMMCKYTHNERLINDHLHTALAWLNNLRQNEAHYSTNRLLQAHTFFISVMLALDKTTEAVKALDDFKTRFQEEANSEFWLQRASSLVDESMGESSTQ